jgi:hypothetical protein
MWFAHIVLKLRISSGIWDGLFLMLYAAVVFSYLRFLNF